MDDVRVVAFERVGVGDKSFFFPTAVKHREAREREQVVEMRVCFHHHKPMRRWEYRYECLC